MQRIYFNEFDVYRLQVGMYNHLATPKPKTLEGVLNFILKDNILSKVGFPLEELDCLGGKVEENPTISIKYIFKLDLINVDKYFAPYEVSNRDIRLGDKRYYLFRESVLKRLKDITLEIGIINGEEVSRVLYIPVDFISKRDLYRNYPKGTFKKVSEENGYHKIVIK